MADYFGVEPKHLRPAKELGMTTILVGTSTPVHTGIDSYVERVHDILPYVKCKTDW